MKASHVQLCGVSLGSRGQVQFLLLASGSIFSAVGFFSVQEKVVRDAKTIGFYSSAFFTFATTFTFCLCAQAERIAVGCTARKGAIKHYLALSVMTFAGAFLTMESLNSISYVTRVLFKSSKLVPTMIMGTMIQGRKYNFLEYASAGCLIAGVSLFVLGDSDSQQGAPGDYSKIWQGVLFIAGGVVADAATSNFEEKVFFRSEEPCSTTEVICWSSLFASLYSLITVAIQGDAARVYQLYVLDHPELLLFAFASAVMGYLSVNFVMTLISQYGATICEMVKSLRKVCSVLLSFLLFPRVVTWKYVLGGLMVLVSLAATQELQRRKGGDVRDTKKEALLKTTEAESEGGEAA